MQSFWSFSGRLNLVHPFSLIPRWYVT